MAKRIALKDHVSVDAVDLSNFARAVAFSSEHERIDVSGFNATGANEYLAGATEQEVTVEFFGVLRRRRKFTQTLYPIHRDREIVAFEWRPDQTAAVSRYEPPARGQRPAAHLQPVRHQGRRGSLGSHVRRRRQRRARLHDRPLNGRQKPSPSAASASLIRDFKTFDRPVNTGDAERAPRRRRHRPHRRQPAVRPRQLTLRGRLQNQGQAARHRRRTVHQEDDRRPSRVRRSADAAACCRR